MTGGAGGDDPRAARRANRLAVGLLLLLPIALLWPSLIGREAFLPFSAAMFPPFAAELAPELRDALSAHENKHTTEIPVTFIPELQHVRSELAAGRLPYWNPYARFGAALLATSVVGLLYPPNWLTFLALDPVDGLAVNAYLALAIAGVLMFGFLRALGLQTSTALFGAVALQWSGTLAANLHFYQRIHALAWLPGMLWALTRMAQGRGRERRRAGVGLALCMAMSWLAGFPAYAAGATLIAAGHATWWIAAYARNRGASAAARLAGATGGCAGLGLALAAVQLVPMFAFFPESNRDPDPTRDTIASQAFDPMGFLGYALPDPFATPARAEKPPDAHSLLAWTMYSRKSWDTGIPFEPNYNYVEYTVYPGALVLLLALGGILARGCRWRWFAGGALLILWALACAGPLPGLNDLPFVRSVPPLRFVGPACVLVAALAAIGLETTALTRGRATALLVLGLALAVTCWAARMVLGTFTPETWLAQHTPQLIEYYRPRLPHVSPELVQAYLGAYAQGSYQLLRDNLAHAGFAFSAAALWFGLWIALARGEGVVRALRLLALALTAAELFPLALAVNHGRPDVPPAAPALDMLRRAREARAPAGGFAVIRGATTPVPPYALPPCLLVPERIRDLHAYTFVDARSHRLFVALYGAGHMLRHFWPMAFPDDERLTRPLFDLLGVRFVLANMPLRFGNGTEIALPGRDGTPFYAYERPTALPRAFVVPAVRELADEDAIIAAMIAPSLAPAQAVLATPEQAAALRPHAAAPGAEQRQVTWHTDTPGELDLTVTAGPPGFLVMSDALMRGWTATVDDAAVPITRGNLFMRVVPLGPGAARVRLRYQPPRLYAGAAISGLALLALLALWWGGRRTPTRAADPAATVA